MDGQIATDVVGYLVRCSYDDKRNFIGGRIANIRAAAYIDLDRLSQNFFHAKGNYRNVIAVVKADAYGHGATEVARRLERDGCDKFAVATYEEGVSLRVSGITGEIIVLGYVPDFSRLNKFNLTAVAYDEQSAENCRLACAPAYIKIDTGMRRLGFESPIKAANAARGLTVCGVFTHLAAADSLKGEDIEFTNRQLETLYKCTADLKEAFGHSVPFYALNSAAALRFKCLYDGVRLGIALYGISPSDDVIDPVLLPIMQVKSVISSVKAVDCDCFVSYGRTCATKYNEIIAVVPIGYADGYPRLLSNRGRMLVGNVSARVAGLVTMDQTMLAVGNTDCKVGDEVTVLGGEITAAELARLAETIPYEITCGFSKRVPRIYI